MLGFDPGPPDGLVGPRTRSAISHWQAARGKTATGRLDAKSASVHRQAGATARPAKEGDVGREAARRTLSEALRVARGITDAKERARVLASIAEAQGNAGEDEAAARSIAEALGTAANITKASERNSALWMIAWAQAATGDSAGALSSAQRITEASSRTYALIAIADARAQAGNITGARRIARNMAERKDRVRALNRMAQAQTKTSVTTMGRQPSGTMDCNRCRNRRWVLAVL